MSRPASSHALAALALCFLASAALRVERVAAQSGIEADAADAAPSMAAAEATDPGCEGDVAATLRALKLREGEFAKREVALEARAAMLEVVEARLEERLAALEDSRARLARTVAAVDGAQSRDIDHLVGMYGSMKPKRAGALLDGMDIGFASELLARMKPETAAGILANMETEKAFTVSLSIARRNAGAPKE